MLSFLEVHPEDYKGAILQLPRSSRLLYVRTYSSYLFNKLASFRAKLSNRLMIGDLVYAGEQQRNKTWKEYKDEEGNLVSTQTLDKRLEGHNYSRIVALPEVRHLTQADINSGEFSMEDVLLPAPGRFHFIA